MRKALLWVVTTLCVVAAGVFGKNLANWAVPPPQGGQSLEELLLGAAASANKKLPMTMDAHTRADQMLVRSPNTLVNKYTLLKIDTPLTGEFDEIKAEMKAKLIELACKNSKVVALLDRGVTNVYEYYAVDGALFGTLAITKADCSR